MTKKRAGFSTFRAEIVENRSPNKAPAGKSDAPGGRFCVGKEAFASRSLFPQTYGKNTFETSWAGPDFFRLCFLFAFF
ncbi:hypothetical protein B5F36_05400 [Anaerofilum sp. An201]|nr:hypothetical protein B5F36_05400 [Anaerofilum sp. An201]